MPLADGPDLSLSAAYHSGRCSDLLCLAKTDRPDKPPCALANENQFWSQRGIFKNGGTEFGSLVGGVGLQGPLQVTPLATLYTKSQLLRGCLDHDEQLGLSH